VINYTIYYYFYFVSYNLKRIKKRIRLEMWFYNSEKRWITPRGDAEIKNWNKLMIHSHDCFVLFLHSINLKHSFFVLFLFHRFFKKIFKILILVCNSSSCFLWLKISLFSYFYLFSTLMIRMCAGCSEFDWVLWNSD